MIGKISTPRGEHVQPLLYYLFGPGRREEHTDPHIVAGWRHPASLEPPLRPDGTRDFTKLTGLLLQPQAALGKRAYARPVLPSKRTHMGRIEAALGQIPDEQARDRSQVFRRRSGLVFSRAMVPFASRSS